MLVSSLREENERLSNTVADLKTQLLKAVTQNETFCQITSDLSVRLEFEKKVSDHLKTEVEKL